MSFNPKRRYSAVAVMSEDLDRVVLIHKLRPDWQAGKANLPGGKVEEKDFIFNLFPPLILSPDIAQLNAAMRELREETGLDVAAAALQLFCRLRYKSREGDDAECCFYAVRGDVDAARTMAEERVFVAEVDDVLTGEVTVWTGERVPGYRQGFSAPTMPNLPYLVAMARQCLRGEGAGSWPLTVYENGAV